MPNLKVCFQPVSRKFIACYTNKKGNLITKSQDITVEFINALIHYFEENRDEEGNYKPMGFLDKDGNLMHKLIFKDVQFEYEE